MKKFKNIESLQKFIKDKCKSGMNDVGKKVQESLKFFVLKNVYCAFTPEEYQRTYQLLESISFKLLQSNKNQITVDIYFDKSKMQHTTLFGSEKLAISPNSNVYIPKWVDEGKTWDKPFHPRGGGHFMKDTLNDVKKNHRGFHYFAYSLVEHLRKSGIQVKKIKMI